MPTRKLMSETIGSACAPTCCSVSSSSERWKRALPATSRTTLRNASPRNARSARASRTPSSVDVPTRARKNGRRAPALVSLRSGTAAARASKRRMPSGSGDRSASSPRRCASAAIARRKITRPLSQASTPPASNATRENRPSLCASSRTAPASGSRASSVQRPLRRSSTASLGPRATCNCQALAVPSICAVAIGRCGVARTIAPCSRGRSSTRRTPG